MVTHVDPFCTRNNLKRNTFHFSIKFSHRQIDVTHQVVHVVCIPKCVQQNKK